MSIHPFRSRRPRKPARHAIQQDGKTPAQAAAFADAMHSRPDSEPAVMAAASAPWAGAQDPAMRVPEVHHEPRPDDTLLLSSVRPRGYAARHASPCLLPAIELDRESLLWIGTAIASGRYEDIDAYAGQAYRRMHRGFDRAHHHVRVTLTAGLRQMNAIAAAGRVAA